MPTHAIRHAKATVATRLVASQRAATTATHNRTPECACNGVSHGQQQQVQQPPRRRHHHRVASLHHHEVHLRHQGVRDADAPGDHRQVRGRPRGGRRRGRRVRRVHGERERDDGAVPQEQDRRQ